MDLAAQLAREAFAAARRLTQQRTEAIAGLALRRTELESDIARLMHDDGGAEALAELQEKIATNEASLARARQRNLQEAATLHEATGKLARSLLPVGAALSTSSSRAAIARAFDDAASAFRDELAAQGISLNTSSFAEIEAGLVNLVALIDEARSQLVTAAQAASSEIAAFSAARSRLEGVASRVRDLEDREAAVLQRIARHSPPQIPQLPLVASLLHADARSLGGVRKHVLDSKLAQLAIEQQYGFTGRDPLEEITGLGSSEDAVESMKSGAFDYLSQGHADLAGELRKPVEKAFAEQVYESMEMLLRKGESATLELKSTLRWDLKQQRINRDLESVVVKTIAGFLNSAGGTLLVGVDDARNPIGLQYDYETLRKKDRDGFEAFLFKLLLDAYGRDIAPFLHVDFDEVSGKDVCRVATKPSSRPVYVVDSGGKDHLFIRTGNSTIELSAREAVEYSKIRWK